VSGFSTVQDKDSITSTLIRVVNYGHVEDRGRGVSCAWLRIENNNNWAGRCIIEQPPESD